MVRSCNGSGVALHELLLDELFPTIADVMTADGADLIRISSIVG